MIWFFDRQGERLRYEVRHTDQGEGYELAVCYPDGTVQVERLSEPELLLKRCAELAEILRKDGWRSS